MTRALFILAMVVFSSPALGQGREPNQTPWNFAIGASTAGLKFEATYRLSDRWALRGFAGGGITVGVREEISGVNYDANLNLGGAALNVDYYPFEEGFRLSAGAFFTDTLFSGVASGTLQIGDRFYDATVETRIEPEDRYLPFVSVGYELPIYGSLFLSADVGAIYNSGLRATITPMGGDPIDVTDLIKERAQIEGKDFPAYPFVSINLGFNF